MGKKDVILCIIMLIIAVAGLTWSFWPKSDDTLSSEPTPTINITYQNLAQVVGASDVVRSIPEGSEILLKFYSFSSGERVWVKTYAMTSGNMKEITDSDEKADIVLTLDSKYINGLTNRNFCSMIQQANANGDLGFETDLSTAAMAWKFKSMYEYRECFGF